MIILGIDPGKTGAIAIFDTDTFKCAIAQLPMINKVLKSKKARKRSFMNTEALRDFIRKYPTEMIAYLEDVASSPQMGVVSAFTFGENFGTLKGLLGGLDIPVNLVRPQLWKRVLKLPADKKKTVEKICKMCHNGSHVFYGSRGGHKDGLAEAFGLAVYGTLDQQHKFKILPTVKLHKL